MGISQLRGIRPAVWEGGGRYVTRMILKAKSVKDYGCTLNREIMMACEA